MPKGRKGKQNPVDDGSQLGLFDGPRRAKRRSLRKGESRRYRSKKGHTYELVRVD